MAPTEINAHLQRMARRAEKAHDDVLQACHVPLPALSTQLELPEHQILYGRRGTGKTHLLRMFQQEREHAGDVALYIDLRRVGAAGTAHDREPDEQAAALLIDLVELIHGHIYARLTDTAWAANLVEVCEAMDALAEAVTRVRLRGETEIERVQAHDDTSQHSWELRIDAARPGGASATRASARTERDTRRHLERGTATTHILMSPLSAAVGRLAAALTDTTLWLCIDEWSSLPLDLQPRFADLLRKAFFAHPNLVVKISALRGRSRFIEFPEAANPVGIELGADTAATLDLDDYLIFGNDVADLLSFYTALIQKHFAAAMRQDAMQASQLQQACETPRAFVAAVFAARSALHHLALNAEGIPRDALQILGLAAGQAGRRAIDASHIDEAARQFFLRDKQDNIPDAAGRAFARITYFCVRNKSRVVPLRRRGESDDPTIQALYNARVLHLVHSSVSLDSRRPGDTYDIYVIDIGVFLDVHSEHLRTSVDHGARFLDLAQIKTRGRTAVRLPPRWYSEKTNPLRNP